jgi:TonB-linked SusC/RagA family outer membrane protein
MKKHYFLILMSLFLLPIMVLAQTKTITGVVKDEDGSTLPGANIIVKGVGTGTISNTKGEFSLKVPENATLAVSFIGYDLKEVSVKGKLHIEIIMTPLENVLDEVVSIGYQAVHESDLTASVSSISSKEIENIPVVSVSQLIGSLATGVQAVQQSGLAGARGSIVIRGNTSISGDLDPDMAYSSPLYVIDGVQTSLEDLAGYNVSNIDYLASLNPDDIERIDILKDASAAAIYGSRGANGVIIIETKKGKALSKPEFNVSANFGYQPIPPLVPMYTGTEERRRKMDMIHQWWDLQHQQDGTVPIMLTDSLNPSFNNNVDYQGLFYQVGKKQKVNASMRGGAKASNYRLSIGFDNSEGIVVNTGFKRITLTSSINSSIGKRFENQFLAKLLYTDQATGKGNPWQGRFNLNSTLPVNPSRLPSSLFFVSDEQIQSLKGELEDKMNTDRTIQSVFSDFIRISLFKGMTLNWQGAFTYSSNKKNFYEPSTVRPEGDGFASYALYNRMNPTSDLYLSYINTFNESHNLSAILGTRADYNQYESMYINAIGYGSDAIKVINSRYQKDEIGGSTNITENSLLSFYFRGSYDFRRKYYLSFTYSRDGSSRFGPDVRWANFPSLSTAWVISREPFMQSLTSNFIDFLRVRFSWGINGKQFAENYLRYGAYSLGYGGNPYWSNQMDVSSYAGTTGVVPNYGAIGNDKLSWENTTQWNIGADLDIFDRRVNITFDAYHKLTDQLLFNVNFPAYSGYNSARANVAGILNYGWEAQVTGRILPPTSPFRVDVTVGVYQNKNYVSQLPNGNRDYIASNYGYVVGRPINLYKMFILDYIIDDLDQLPVNPYTGIPLHGKSAWAAIRPGFPIWKDLNGDYLLNETHDYKLTLDYSPVPDIMGNFNINMMFKGFYLQMYSQFSFGADIKNTIHQSYLDYYDRGGTGWATNGLVDLSDFSFWEKPGDGAAGVRYPAMYPTSAGTGGPWYGFRGNQTLWMESGDYWKISNISMGYTFEKNSIIKKIGLKRLRLYSSILNPWQWQKSDAVPDASLVNAKGEAYGNGYPIARTVTFGIDVRF